MVIFQCRGFLKMYSNVKFLEPAGTVNAEEKVSQLKNKSVAAIGSQLESEIYNLGILENSIASENINFTQFFIISKNM